MARFRCPSDRASWTFLRVGRRSSRPHACRFPGEAGLFPFIAFRREAIHLIDAGTDEAIEAPGSGGHTTPHPVEVFLLAGLLRGTLQVLVNVRLSDFLRQQTGLLVLRDCSLAPYGEPSASPKVRKMRVVLLNTAKVLGIGEPANPVSPVGG